MKKALKWFLIAVVGLIVLIVIVAIAIPLFVDLDKYKPRVEQAVSEAAGRPFSIGGDIDLSLFPWVGFSASDIRMGNPPGFQEKDFASVDTMEVRVKLLPLISRDIQVKKFVVASPRIAIEKDKNGRTNLEGLGKPSGEAKEKASESESGGLPIKDLTVDEFAVTKGSLLWIDHGTGERREISDFSLNLQDVSLDHPIAFTLSAQLDGQPIEAGGNLGPVGRDPGKGSMPLDLQVRAFKELVVDLKGHVIDPAAGLRFDLDVKAAPFSPRNLLEKMGRPLAVATADPSVLGKVAFQSKIQGSADQVVVSDGILEIDDSKLQFSARAKDFAKPDLAFNIEMDRIDLDRYMPPPSEKKPGEEQKEEAPPAESQPVDYAPLRKLILDGAVKIGELKAHGARIEQLSMKIAAKNGVFNLNPLTLKLYQGDVSANGVLNVQRNTPETKMTLQVKDVTVNPLLKDLLQKDFLEGTLAAALDLTMSGDNAAKVKQTLNGKGDLRFVDGAVVGIDLAGMVRNAKAAFGLSEKTAERPRTDFSELNVPFTIQDGVFNTTDTNMASPFLRVQAAGKADLVKEFLDFRVEPKFVVTLKGQGDTAERSGLTVPVLVAGSFDAPKFRPDLEGMLKGRLEQEIPQGAEELKRLLPGQKSSDENSKSTEEKAKDVLKGIFDR